MELTVFKDHHALSDHAANMILSLVRQKPNAVICLASGDTPRLTCALLAEKASRDKVDFTRCTFIGLDEWVGVPPENDGSCQYFFRNSLFKPLQIADSQIHLFDAMSTDLGQECRKMDEVIFANGGIDLIIVGVGMNGHIGFNEPGVSADLYSHVIDLEEETRTVGQKYFREAMTLAQGITLGLKHFMQARCAIVMANGAKKAGVILKAIEGEITMSMPASIIRNHSNGHLMLDEAAASALTGRQPR